MPHRHAKKFNRPCVGSHLLNRLRGSRPVYAALHVALLAHHLLRRDVDYIVRGGKVQFVDELTGRVTADRRWPHGIQAALEVKEGLAVQESGRIHGSITVQHFINLYEKKAAMTATAVTAALELNRFYRLPVVVIPPRCPVRRRDEPDAVLLTQAAKRAALAEEISRQHATGRPILVGTRSVEESENLAGDLTRRGLCCRVLNAKNDREEAKIIARAGLLGAITISTNMAGRGTDIRLGGAEGRERKRLIALGGLLVIGTNRHESVRVDRQLRGRAGRQGDPGGSRFFVSLEDELFRRYGVPEFLPRKSLKRAAAEPMSPVTDRWVAREIERAQSIIENQNFVIRRTLRRYSLLVEEERRIVQNLRRAALFRGELPEELLSVRAAPLNRPTRALMVRLFLAVLDRFWADHLELVEDLREGISLQRYGGREPLYEFIRLAAESFEEGLGRVLNDCAREFRKLARGGRPGEEAVLRAPSSTWTYALDDEPLPAFNLAAFTGGFNPAVFGALAVSVLKGFMLLAQAIRKIFSRAGKRGA